MLQHIKDLLPDDTRSGRTLLNAATQMPHKISSAKASAKKDGRKIR
jgi:hypothetical protein